VGLTAVHTEQGSSRYTLPFHLQFDHVLRIPKQTRRKELIILSREDQWLEIAADVARNCCQTTDPTPLLVKKGVSFSATQNTRCHHFKAYLNNFLQNIFKFEHLVELLRRPLDNEIRHKQYKPENQSNFVDFHSGPRGSKGNRLPPERDKVNFLSLFLHNGNATLTLSVICREDYTPSHLYANDGSIKLSYGSINFQTIYCYEVGHSKQGNA